MQAVTIVNQAGPLPIEKTGAYIPSSATAAVLVVTGSLWSQQANQVLQLNVSWNGQLLAIARVFCNAAVTHQVLPTLFIPFVNLGQGGDATLTLSLGAGNATADENDFFTATVMW